MRRRLSLIMVLILGLLLFSCSKNSNDNPANSLTEEPPEGLAVDSLQVPPAMQQSTDPYALMTIQYIQQVNFFQIFTYRLTPPFKLDKIGVVQNTADGPPWTYTWSQAGITVTLTITIEDNQYHWVLTYTGTVENVQLDQVKIFEAWQDLAGTSGKMLMYDLKTQVAVAEWTWSKDEQGAVTFVYKNLQTEMKIIVTQYHDLSGNLEVYENGQLTFKASWKADGSGTWWTYEDGNQTGTGSWS